MTAHTSTKALPSLETKHFAESQVLAKAWGRFEIKRMCSGIRSLMFLLSFTFLHTFLKWTHCLVSIWFLCALTLSAASRVFYLHLRVRILYVCMSTIHVLTNVPYSFRIYCPFTRYSQESFTFLWDFWTYCLFTKSSTAPPIGISIPRNPQRLWNYLCRLWAPMLF